MTTLPQASAALPPAVHNARRFSRYLSRMLDCQPWLAEALAASIAKSYCSEVYARTTQENIFVHGGIGFTWDHDAHLYFKRAKSSEILLGDVAHHRELISQRIGLN